MSKKFGPIVAAIVLVLIVLRSAFFIVDQTKQAIVVQLGKPVGEARGPGLHMKLPFVQEVILFENRLLDYDASPAEILTRDKKNLVVDNYAKWKIVNPLRFYRTVQSVDGAQSRLDDIIFAELRVELGRHQMIEIISKLRSEIMASVTERSNKRAEEFGISVVDVRIKRADLPQENERAVFGRMRAERQREAKRYRSMGEEAAIKLRADADRQRSVILAEAYRTAQETKGEGDAQATAIFAEAYGQNPEFFSFQRTLESYRKALEKGTTMVLSQDDEFLRFMKESGADLSEATIPAPTKKPKEPVKPPQADASPATPEKPAGD